MLRLERARGAKAEIKMRRKPMPRTQRREQLLQVAAEVIGEGGLSALTMEALAERADVAKPTAVEQRTIWQRLLGDGAGDHPQQLAGHFDFNLGKIEQIASPETMYSKPSGLFSARFIGQPAMNLLKLEHDARGAAVAGSGGTAVIAGAAPDMVAGIREGHATAVRASSIFHFGEFTIREAKDHMVRAGLPMRLDP